MRTEAGTGVCRNGAGLRGQTLNGCPGRAAASLPPLAQEEAGATAGSSRAPRPWPASAPVGEALTRSLAQSQPGGSPPHCSSSAPSPSAASGS